MPYDPDRHHRRSIRLRGYDYAGTGAYFITVVTHERACLFGAVTDAVMRRNAIGSIVAEAWAWLARQYPYVTLDQWTVMPNHLHGIIAIDSGELNDGGIPPKLKPLGRLIGAFKTTSTKRVNEQRNRPGAVLWQRNYYERIIRDDDELNRIRQYIDDNPVRWALDRENLERPARGMRLS